MTRRALFYSLVLHAGFLVLVGWRSPATANHAGPGDPGVGVSFLSEMHGAALLVEATPVAEPPQEESAVEPPLPEPQISTPPPAIPAPMAAMPAIPREEFRPVPSISPIKPNRPSRSTAASGANTRSGRKGGASAEGSGATLAGAGHGGGGPGYVPPQFRVRYKPPYPEEARAQRLEGTVLLLVKLDTDGKVIEAGVRQSCGHSLLDRAALEAVRSWRFYPARQDGTAIAAQVEVPVNFRFEERRAART